MGALTDPQDWPFPVPIAYGPGRLTEIGAQARAARMARPLLVTDRGSAELPFIGTAMDHLKNAGTTPALFSGIAPNPRDEDVAAGRDAFLAGGHDGIIAMGGGSGMDGGKAIALVAGSDTPLWDFDYNRSVPALTDRDFPPLITVPTTAGTGAETESTAMVTDTDKGMKWCVWHAACKPRVAILDPELTLGLPRHLTAWTGADALTHAIEAYLVPGFHPLCDGAALESLRLIARWLPVAVAEPDNLDARGAMLVGSCLGGIAFLQGLGLVHAISHMVGAEYDTHHGLLNGVLLPPVLRYNAPEMLEKAGPLAEAMSLDDRSVDGVLTGVTALLHSIDVPRDLSGLGIPLACAPRIGEKALHDSAAGTNPRRASAEDIAAILTEVLPG